MDILEFAMQMELDGKAFYEKGMERAENPSVKKIFKMLADEEHRHYQVFRKLSSGEKPDPATDLTPSGATLNEVKNIFKEMTDAGKESLEGDTTKDLWLEALEVEKKAEKMYRDAAEKETDIHRKDILTKIADEEKTHIYLIDNLISFLADPETFIASQNYKNFQSWEGR